MIYDSSKNSPSHIRNMEKVKALEQKLIKDLENSIRRSRNLYEKYIKTTNNRINKRQYYNTLKRLETYIQKKDKTPKIITPIIDSPIEDSPIHEHLKRFEFQKPPLKIPICVPQSIIRKSQRCPLPTIQHTMRNGEIATVHILSESAPVFDPLVMVQAEFNLEDAKNEENSAEKSSTIYLSQINPFSSNDTFPRFSSLQDHKLTEPKGIPKLREYTPKKKAHTHVFRDLSFDSSMIDSKKQIVSERMKNYAGKVKEFYTPRQSESKQIEFLINQERLKKQKPVRVSKVKLEELADENL
ncbi:unnamed protein product [Blepharisma stoltei]|uniref:Uncharacterized protein n=1 Tax=Blepharisma stoltei TaxID=1481888 RepID=A0AAU9IYI3_9CILI|nr:unnamed protein product [Blepharisma stoltei]